MNFHSRVKRSRLKRWVLTEKWRYANFLAYQNGQKEQNCECQIFFDSPFTFQNTAINEATLPRFTFVVALKMGIYQTISLVSFDDQNNNNPTNLFLGEIPEIRNRIRGN